MRSRVDASVIQRFMAEVGRAARGEGKVYLVGGATALLKGWRATTVDIDILMDPEPRGVAAAIPGIKERLDLNVEPVPRDVLPPIPGWAGRSEWIARHGSVDFFHLDLCSQALAKLNRGLETDLVDVEGMLASGDLDPIELRRRFEEIRPEIRERYFGVDDEVLDEAVERAIQGHLPTPEP